MGDVCYAAQPAHPVGYTRHSRHFVAWSLTPSLALQNRNNVTMSPTDSMPQAHWDVAVPLHLVSSCPGLCTSTQHPSHCPASQAHCHLFPEHSGRAAAPTARPISPSLPTSGIHHWMSLLIGVSRDRSNDTQAPPPLTTKPRAAQDAVVTQDSLWALHPIHGPVPPPIALQEVLSLAFHPTKGPLTGWENLGCKEGSEGTQRKWCCR